MKIEKEIRYYFPTSRLGSLSSKLRSLYSYQQSFHEVTTMYDNPNPALTFYSEAVDGRLRLRYSTIVKSKVFGEGANEDAPSLAQCLVTWKRRLPGGLEGAVRREEEVEYTVPAREAESVRAIFEDVLQCKRVSSYERIRSFFASGNVQVTCDEFPYGIMLELELKDAGAKEDELFREVARLGLNKEDASSLSCDDMYFKLCEEAGIEPLADIAFDDRTMPQIRE